MDIDLVIKNYRCFTDVRPARLSLRPGFVGLLGANNSGKSSLLRFFYEFRGLFNFLASPTGNFVSMLQGQAQGVFNYPETVKDPTEVFTNRNSRPLTIEIAARAGSGESQSTSRAPRVTLTVSRGGTAVTAAIDGGLITATDFRSLSYYEGHMLLAGGSPWADMADFMAACRLLAQTVYIGPFRNALNLGSAPQYFDIPTGQAFIALWKSLKQGTSKSGAEFAWKIKNDVQRIFGFGDLEISPSSDDTTLTLMIDGRNYRLDEQGSGFAQFVIVLASVAARAPAYLLIDEPETGLHPSLQLDFLTTLASYASEGVMFATHSVGLARSSSTLLYSLRRNSEGEAEMTPFEGTEDLAEFMGALGFTAYKELGFEQVLLVEGPHEVKSVQQFLRGYGKEHQVVLLPMGGAQMISGTTQVALEHVRRITDKVAALIDSEKASNDEPLGRDRVSFRTNCEKAGVKCHVLARRAIENYLTDRAIKAVKGEKYRALSAFERLADAQPSWAKADNWRIAREMTRAELDGTDLGDFFESL